VANAAEHTSAISFALKGKMSLSLSIGIGSGTQLALFVVPLVIFGIVLGQHFTLDLTFFKLVSVLFGILIIGYTYLEMESLIG
jgi:Ca2+:H+ antiporter